MREINNLAGCIKNFDALTYPTQLYQDLVVDGNEATNKLTLMGAWKTGSIRTVNKEKVDQPVIIHTDTKGYGYVFTGRWKLAAPVGYDTWLKLTANQKEFRQRIPSAFTPKQPDIVSELVEEKGFGFIWTLFVLHCYYPEVYPLYDQHVYRTYKYHESDYHVISRNAPNNWDEYANYRAYFLEQLAKHDYPYWELDRGLWALGKALKRRGPLEQEINTEPIDLIAVDGPSVPLREEEAWVQSLTLGGKEKQFHWRLDDAFNVSILRQFKSANYGPVTHISVSDLSKLISYVAGNSEVTLSNNVKKLGDKTEKEGLGRFLHETLGWDITAAQLASQLAALFVEAGIWQWNEQRRGMRFNSITNNWQESLRRQYNHRLKDID